MTAAPPPQDRKGLHHQHDAHHGHGSKKKRIALYGMLPTAFGFQLIKRKKSEPHSELRDVQPSGPEIPGPPSPGPDRPDTDPRLQMAERVWSVESLLAIGVLLLVGIYLLLYQLLEVARN